MPFSASAGTATFTGSPAAPAAAAEFLSAASAGISMRERPTMVLTASALDTFSTSPVMVNGPAAAASAKHAAGRRRPGRQLTRPNATPLRFGLGAIPAGLHALQFGLDERPQLVLVVVVEGLVDAVVGNDLGTHFTPTLIADASPLGIVHLVQRDVVIFGSAAHLDGHVDGHVDESEGDRTGADASLATSTHPIEESVTSSTTRFGSTVDA